MDKILPKKVVVPENQYRKCRHAFVEPRISGAGIILTCGDEIMLIEEKGKLGDLGGKVEVSDLTPIETAQREFFEESGVCFHSLKAEFVTCHYLEGTYVVFEYKLTEKKNIKDCVWVPRNKLPSCLHDRLRGWH